MSDVGASAEHAPNSAQDNLSLSSAGEPRAAPSDASPRESRDLRLLTCEILIVPAAATTWAKGVFGNAVAIATFESTTDSLTIES